MEKQIRIQEQQEREKEERVQEPGETEKQIQIQEQQEREKEEQVKEPGEMEKQEPEEMKEQVEKEEPEEMKEQVEKQQKVQEPEEREQELEEHPYPPPKTNSPPRKAEVQRAKPSSPPKLTLPTLLPHQNSEPKSPPLDSPPSEVEDDYKKTSFKDPITTTPPPNAAAYTVEQVPFKVGITSQEFNNQERVGGGITGSGRTYMRPKLSILDRSRRDNMVKRAFLASRICGFVFSLVSFSVLAADRDRGWALDSFYRYKEFRYCMAVNVIAFVYSGFQGYDMAYQMTSGKRKVRHHLRYYLDFLVDQMLTYLLMSSSSSAAVRIDDWQSNWGKDEFPQMARASVALSFLAFVALALSSLISGYSVFTLKSI